MKKMNMGCTALDNLLGGGLEPGILTLIYGESGTGKTNICLQVACDHSSRGKKIVYITSEGVSRERLSQICKKKNKEALENILFFSPASLREQEEIIDKALKIRCGLLMVDTINKFYRLQLGSDEKSADRSLARQMVSLQLAAKKYEIPIILTGQVYQNATGVKPFANRIITPLTKTIIQLEKNEEYIKPKSEQREATLIKHRIQKINKKVRFSITAQGIE